MNKKKLDLTVQKSVYGGFGLCFYEEKTILVPKVLAGEKIRVSLRKKKKKAYLAELETILSHPENSPRKANQDCSHFLECGGCSYQMLSYSEQLKLKEKILAEIFENQLSIKEIVSSPEQFFYRNKCEFSFGSPQGDKLALQEKLELGLHPLGAFEKVILQKECLLIPPIVWQILSKIKLLAKESNLAAFEAISGEGFWSSVTVRYSDYQQEKVLICFKVANLSENNYKFEERKKLQMLCSELKELFGEQIAGIFAQDVQNRSIETIFGEKELKQSVEGVVFSYQLENFFQINFKCLADFLQLINKIVKKTKAEFILDLFAGVGLIGIYLAVKSAPKFVFAAEADASACQIAQRNAKANQVSNYQNIHLNLYKGGWGDDLKELIQEKVSEYPKNLCLILDPPRAGISKKTIKQISKLIPKSIIYISCNPTTQKRDCDLLNELGYRLKELNLVDMFPQTMHIESVALLELEE